MRPPEEELQVSSDAVERMGSELSTAVVPSRPRVGPSAAAPEYRVWDFEDGKGTAWVFPVNGSDAAITNPVMFSDGFEGKPSSVDDWLVLWRDDSEPVDPEQPPHYPWGKDLHAAGKDVIILGYADRKASILDNARIARACIRRVIEEREGDTPLVVGGFSMGGLITRYTLALMETEGEPHETSTYFSYDSPHRGGWVPISVQAFAHFMASRFPNVPAAAAMSEMLNSDASRQMALYHISTHKGNPQAAAPDPLRDSFLAELERVGWFPKQVTKRIGVANGPGNGDVRALPADNTTLKCNRPTLNVSLYGQAPDDQHLVAQLTGLLNTFAVKTTGVPALDGAPGGTLQTNGIAVNALNEMLPEAPSTDFPWVCFVPTVSAVDVADPKDSATDPIPDAPPQGCGLHAYKCATASDDPKHYAHTLLTEELCTWLLNNFE